MSPLSQDGRQQLVQNIFNRIAARYDFLNRVISFRCDTSWRKKAVRALALGGSRAVVLDLGSGTGDLALTAAKEIPEAKIVGLDFSLEMLRFAQEKKRRAAAGDRTFFVLGSALEPPFKEETFDAVMTAFVLRNITDLNLFFRHAYRLLRPGGKIVSLDMFPPSRLPFSFFYSFYFYRMVPWIGTVLAQDRGAYQYLSDSVKSFNPPETIAELIRQTGFKEIKIQKFMSGAVCLHLGEKPRIPR